MPLFRDYDPDEFRISSIIKKMHCHSGEGQNLPPLNIMTLPDRLAGRT